ISDLGLSAIYSISHRRRHTQLCSFTENLSELPEQYHYTAEISSKERSYSGGIAAMGFRWTGRFSVFIYRQIQQCLCYHPCPFLYLLPYGQDIGQAQRD